MKVTLPWLSLRAPQVMCSSGGGLLMPLSDGGIRHLLAGARASVGLKSGAGPGSNGELASGEPTKSHGKWQKSWIFPWKMVIFHSKMLVYQRICWGNAVQMPWKMLEMNHVSPMTIIRKSNIYNEYTLWWTNILPWKMAIEIVDFPIKNSGSFHGKMLVHQRICWGNGRANAMEMLVKLTMFHPWFWCGFKPLSHENGCLSHEHDGFSSTIVMVLSKHNLIMVI